MNALQQGKNTLQGRTTANPFVPISRGWLALLVTYVLLYRVLTPGLRQVLFNSSAPLSGWRTLLDIVHQLLIFAPILFYRSRFGWLHPLIFITIFGLGKSFMSDPGQLLAPLRLFQGPVQETLTHPALPEIGERAMAQATVEHQLLSIAAMLCYYTGFFFEQKYRLLAPRLPRLKFVRPRLIAPVALAAVGCSAVVALVYLQQHGGLNSYLLYYFNNRMSRSAESGSVFFVVQGGVNACLVWYALNEKALYNPLFWGAAAFAVPINFVIRGSRSSVFIALTLFLLIWMIRYQKAPKGRALAMGLVIFALIGVMGEFRRSAWEGEMKWSVFTETSVTEAIEESRKEVDFRQDITGGVPVVVRVPEEVDFLYGSTYAGAILALVPRALWENKPKGAGLLNGQIILKRGETGGGVPTGSVAEAYWNFWIPGVITIFLIYGIFHKWLARVFRWYAGAPAIWVPYLLALLWMEPDSNQLNNAIQNITFVLILLVAMGAIRLRKRQPLHAS